MVIFEEKQKLILSFLEMFLNKACGIAQLPLKTFLLSIQLSFLIMCNNQKHYCIIMDHAQHCFLPMPEPLSDDFMRLDFEENRPEINIPPEHKATDFLISPYLSPLNNRFLGLNEPSPVHKYLFKNVDELQLQEIEAEGNANESSFSQEISKLPFKRRGPIEKKFSSQIQTLGRTPKELFSTQRSANGLRVISGIVYQIVLEEKITTYKDVANKLVDFKYAKTIGDDKEKNIKRRVYDSLNVLVAAGVFQKNGKQVSVWNSSNLDELPTEEYEEADEFLEKILLDNRERKKTLQEKREYLKELKKREEVIEAITMRNKTRKYLSQRHVEFPSVGVICEKMQGLKLQEDDKVVLKMEGNCEVKGDLDMIMEANLMAHNTHTHTQTYAPFLDELKTIPTLRTLSNILQS